MRLNERDSFDGDVHCIVVTLKMGVLNKQQESLI